MTDTGARISLDATPSGVRVHDHIEGTEFLVETDGRPDLEPALPEVFPFPVDRAVAFETRTLSLSSYSWVSVRDERGDLIAHLHEPMEFDEGTYCVDVKAETALYARVVDAEIEATGMEGDGPVRLEFDERCWVTLGVRSLHTRPEATVTVSDDPEAMMTAVSVLGSSIKEFSPERSWPTLRGYPPRIERGSELHVPDHLRTPDRLRAPDRLSAPDTGIRITVPPTYEAVYRIAPLAFYLGAAVEPDSEAAIRLETGYTELLPADGSALEERVEELLGVCLLLDSLCRTDGYVPSDRYEYERVGSELPFYPPNLMDRTPSERLMEYLEVDPSVLKPYVPVPPTRAVLRPTPDAVRLLPHLAHVLAPVRIDEGADASVEFDGTAAGWSPVFPSEKRLRSSPDRHGPPTAVDTFAPSVALLCPESYDNRLDRTLSAQGDAAVAFLTDSADRTRELRAAMSDPAPPDGVDSWRTVESPSREAVLDAFRDPDLDVVVCSLPVTEAGVRARDGDVDLDDLGEAPAVSVFEGYSLADVGLGTVPAGSVGSVVVAGRLAPRRVRTLVGLLSVGTPLGASVHLSRIAETAPVRLVGDPSLTAITSGQGLPKNLFTVRSRTESAHHVTRRGLPFDIARLGSENGGLADWSHDRPELVGSARGGYPTLSPSDVVEIASEPDSLLRLNGRVVFAADGLTEAGVRRSARRALRGELDARDGS